MKRRYQFLTAAAALSLVAGAGWVAAQTVQPTQGEPVAAPAAPPAPAVPPVALPPEEAAPPPESSAPPASPKASQTKPADKADKDDIEAKDDAEKQKEAEQAAAAEAESNKRQVHTVAVVQALDKITAETMRFEVRAGQQVRWKGLVFTLKECETSAPAEPVKDSMAYLQVRSEPKGATSPAASREVFKGWMFASAPGLNPFKHPVYDAWLVSCRA